MNPVGRDLEVMNGIPPFAPSPAEDGEGPGPGFDELLPFFRRAGFMPPEKERLVLSFLPEVTQTFERAASLPCPVLGARVIREGTEIAGYVSCVHAYERTWMFQHLAALPGRRGGPRLSQEIVRYLMGIVGCDYFKMWFHTQNRFPRRAFGAFAASLSNPDVSLVQTFGHIVLSSASRFFTRADICVEEADERALAEVERHFSKTEGILLRDADDLVSARLRLETLNARYRQQGLFRRRHVLVATVAGQLTGVALAELSSPGLNLSEGLSSFRIHVVPGLETEGVAVRAALLDSVCRIYRRAGRPMVLGLVPTKDLEEYARLRLHPEAESYCWTCRASQLPHFLAHLESLPSRERTPPGPPS